MSNQHDYLCALKDLAIEIGRTPLRTEAGNRIRGFKHAIAKYWGGNYAIMIQAAGLDPAPAERLKPAKLTNEIFLRDLPEVLAEHVPRENAPAPPLKRTLIVGDTHFPFVSERTLEAIYEFAESNKPERILQCGDLYDMYAHSKFPRSLNGYSPEQEEQVAREGAEKMWKALRGIAPTAECVQLLGNHDVRPVKRTMEVQPAVEHIVTKYLHGLMTFEGVTLIKDPREEYFADGVQYIHGYRGQTGQHRDYALMNTVCGHLHRGGVSFRRIRGQTLWELNAGLVGDPESKALSYTPQKIMDYTLGFGWIDEHGPRFIPK